MLKRNYFRYLALPLSLIILGFSIMNPAISEEKKTPQRYGTIDAGKEYARVAATMDSYIGAMQKGDVEQYKNLFLPGASYYFIRDGKLAGGAIYDLFEVFEKGLKTNSKDLVSAGAPSGNILSVFKGETSIDPIEYSIPSIQITGIVATVSFDIINMDGLHLYDMFTLIKNDDGEWKIAGKVAWRPDR